MRIVFADSVLDYDLETAYLAPLGGTQSAVCYLAESLAQIGHQVTLITRKAAPAMQRGVACTNFSQVTAGDLSRWAPDALVVAARAPNAAKIRNLLPPESRLILWTGDDPDQPSMQYLRDASVQNSLDAVVLP